MKKTLDAFIARLLVRWVDAVRRHARLIVVSTSLITAALSVYTALALGINSDNVGDCLETCLSARQLSKQALEHQVAQRQADQH